MPRTDPETQQGLVTDVAIKRKIRNMVALLGEGKPGYDIYVEAGVALNAQHKRAYAALGLQAGRRQDQARPRPTRQPPSGGCARPSTTSACSARSCPPGTRSCGRVQGPLQLTFSRSVGPVLSQEHGITRVTQTREDDIDKGETTEMGAKHAIPYGLYVGYGHFSAPLAARTGVTSQDLEMLWRAFTLMFEHDRASTRGEMTLRGLYVFTHADKFGSAPAQALFDRIKITRAPTTSPRAPTPTTGSRLMPTTSPTG